MDTVFALRIDWKIPGHGEGHGDLHSAGALGHTTGRYHGEDDLQPWVDSMNEKYGRGSHWITQHGPRKSSP